ncbi:pentapeptide repeat-containing protein [Spirillospora sp. NPDC029432]|uniref:pentapeptide repeat-containing protein n=1 Tax=Spirillospora sp. NPDC029432 TaxID=3154599 RepID=UPI003454FD81
MLGSVRRAWRAAKARRNAHERPRVRPLAAGFWMLVAASLAGVAIWVTTVWMLGTTNDVLARDAKATAADRARVRLEAVRTGLAAGAGVGAAVGLMLAFRRQRHQEIATALIDHDAGERRVTELYAAAELLGSDKAPVRVTALYTLERLGNHNPIHRQTIVNIICAYLRMPFLPAPPPPTVGEEELAGVPASERAVVAAASAEPTVSWHQERDVRLTAQRLLAAHLRRDAEVPWTGIGLDLTGAILFDFDLSGCTVGTAWFGRAAFSGDADFRKTAFTGHARFVGASFSGRADFELAVFGGDVSFDRAVFSGSTGFRAVKFDGAARFTSATVADLDGDHVLPPGWRVEGVGAAGGRLARDRPANR